MSARRQVGGLQEVFVQTNTSTFAGLERTIAAIAKLGGHVRHAFPPNVLVAVVPAGSAASLKKIKGVVSATDGVVKAPRRAAAGPAGLQSAIAAWNDHIDPKRRLAMMASRDLDKAWDAGGRKPPHPPKKVMDNLHKRELALLPKRARGAVRLGAVNPSIPVLVGRNAVGVVFVDSTVAQFKITNAEKLKIVSEIAEGLNMLAGFEPRANIQWFYDFKRPEISLAASAFTEANKNQWEDLWRDKAMGALGYSASVGGMAAYANEVKARWSAQHAYTVYVTKYPKPWFAYVWGNHAVMDFTVDGWGVDNFSRVFAHETGHIFGCPDEYGSSGCNCTSVHGRYQIANGNCQNCAAPFVPCLMAANTEAVCDYTRGHLGWNELALQSRGTTILKGTWTFDFDTGVQGPPTGTDIWWEQVNNVTRFLVPRGGAMLAHMGKPNFDAVSLQGLKAQAFTGTPINGSGNSANKLTPGTVIAIKTGAGRYAKMKINTYGYNLGITWVTYK